MSFQFKLAGITLALVACSGLTHATPLSVETATPDVGVVSGFFGGTLVASALTNIANVSYSGVARSAVYDTGSGLDFYYQFSNSTASVNGIERFSAFDFRAISNTDPVEVYQTATAFGDFVQGTEVSDYADRTRLGVIGFSFVPNGASKVNPGTSSYIQIIRTTARTFGDGHFGLLDGIGDNARGFAPTTVVPEPSTATLLLGGLAMMGLVARRRSAKQGR